MLVEEAGQVLEAHVLGSLVQSIQQTILIGDPLHLPALPERLDLHRRSQSRLLWPMHHGLWQVVLGKRIELLCHHPANSNLA